MNRAILPACLLLFCFGCENSPWAPELPPAPRIGQKVIVNGLDGAIDVYVDDQGLRVGKYFDFTPYDSLSISFSVQRTDAGQEAVPFSIKIGPAYFISGSLADLKQDYTFSVPVAVLVKPQIAALTFFVPYAGSPLLLSNLRVIGWYTY
jgi:hypothetical protein